MSNYQLWRGVQSRRRLALTAVVTLWLGAVAIGHAGEVPLESAFRVIKGFGPAGQVTAGPGEELVPAGDGRNVWRIKSVAVRDEAHLLQLLGGNESALTDTQRGLLATWRFARTGAVTELTRRFPFDQGRILLELTDITGYEDPARYPTAREDFWPRNLKLITWTGNQTRMESMIRLSGVDSLGYGARTAGQMKLTFAHELGHALDLTQHELNGYGHDGNHWANEVIGAAAAYSEGFANFVQLLLFPSEAAHYRSMVQRIRIEGEQGGYTVLAPTDPRLPATDLLRVEGINALILSRLVATLPGGATGILDVHGRNNSANNTMSKLLRALVAANPGQEAAIARIVDEETHGRLGDDEVRQVLGASPGISAWLAQRRAGSAVAGTGVRSGTGTTAGTGPGSGATPPPAPGRIYKWKDAQGRLHFTDVPPPAGIEYTVMGTSRAVRVDSPGSNPFGD